MKAYFFFIFPVGVYITEENPTSPGLNPKRKLSNTFFFSWILFPNPPKRTKTELKRSFFWLGKIRTGSNPSRKLPLAHQKILISFFQLHFTPPLLAPSFFDLLEWKHNGCAEWTRVARRRHKDNEVSQLLSFRSFFWAWAFLLKGGVEEGKRGSTIPSHRIALQSVLVRVDLHEISCFKAFSQSLGVSPVVSDLVGICLQAWN